MPSTEKKDKGIWVGLVIFAGVIFGVIFGGLSALEALLGERATTSLLSALFFSLIAALSLQT